MMSPEATLDIAAGHDKSAHKIPSAQPIGFVTHRFVRTHGQGRINLEAALYLANAGRKVVAIGEEADADFIAHENIDWRPTHPSRLPTDFARNLSFARAASRILHTVRREYPRIVVLSNGAAMNAPAELNVAMFVHAAWWRSPMHPRFNPSVPAGRLWKTYQAFYTRFNVRAERKAFHIANVAIALTERVRQELIQDVGLDPTRVRIIEPGVDCDEFRPAVPQERLAFRQSIKALPDRVAALFAGDIRTNRKNLDLVLIALAQLPTQVELWVAGSDEGSPYPAMAERLGVASRVRWLGHRTDMAAVMRSADLFLFPSHYEPYGLVVLEAMASGLATIVTQQTGAADAVRGEAGVIIQDGSDLEGLLAGVRGWLGDPQRLAAAKRAARNEALSYTWTAMGAKYADLIEEMAESRVNR